MVAVGNPVRQLLTYFVNFEIYFLANTSSTYSSTAINIICCFATTFFGSELSWRGARVGSASLLKILDDSGGFNSPSKNLSLFRLLSCDQTITIKGAHSVMINFSQFLVYHLISSLTKFLNSS